MLSISKGIDISHHNGILDFKKIKSAGISFVFIKTSEGAFLRDHYFKDNYRKAKAAGLLVGAYHFFRATVPPQKQADNFLGAVKDCPLDLPPVLDWEVTDHQSVELNCSCALKWLDLIEIATKKVPIIYTSPSFFESMKNPKEFKRFPLWLAHYSEKPRVPKPWDSFAIHQYSETGKLDGVPGHFDVNHCDLTKIV